MVISGSLTFTDALTHGPHPHCHTATYTLAVTQSHISAGPEAGAVRQNLCICCCRCCCWFGWFWPGPEQVSSAPCFILNAFNCCVNTHRHTETETEAEAEAEAEAETDAAAGGRLSNRNAPKCML